MHHWHLSFAKCKANTTHDRKIASFDEGCQALKKLWPWCDLNKQPSDLESDALPLCHKVLLQAGAADILPVGVVILAGAKAAIIKTQHNTHRHMFSLSHTHFLTPPLFPLGHQSLCGLWLEQAALAGTKTQIMGWRELLSGLMSQVCVTQRTTTSVFPLIFYSGSDKQTPDRTRVAVCHFPSVIITKQACGPGAKGDADNTQGPTLNICWYPLCWI